MKQLTATDVHTVLRITHGEAMQIAGVENATFARQLWSFDVRQPASYLFDVGITRDVWMHRIDLARATGKALELDADHDGRIVADMVAEWADTHHEPFTLLLNGPAGRTYRSGTGGERVEMDAIEFCRVLAERCQGTGILRHTLPL